MISSIILVLAVASGTVRALIGCDTKADVTFLLDSSGNVGRDNYNKMLEFVKDTTDHMQLGPNHTQVSAVTFGTGAANQFFLNEYTTHGSLKRAIDGIPFKGGQPRLADGIRYVAGSSFSPIHGGRGDAPHVAVVLTNQPSGSFDRVKLESQTARDNGLILYTVGIGGGVDLKELQEIASDPNVRHSFSAENFDALHSLSDLLATKICNELPPDPNMLPAPTGCLQKADVVFMVDSSTSVGNTNFQKLEHFLKDVVQKVPVGPNNVQFGVMKYGSYPTIEFPLGMFTTRAETMKHIEGMTYIGGGTNDADALTYTGNQVLNQNTGARGNVPRIAIMITDGGSSNPSAAIKAADKLRTENIGVMTVGVGNHVNNLELTNIADKSGYSFTASSYDDLDSITDQLITQMCTVTAMQPSLTTAQPGGTLPPDPCQDKLPNCDQYGADTCTNYAQWAQDNCAKTCKICTPLYTAAPPACVDLMADCSSYGIDLCSSFYMQQNCQLFCGLCSANSTGTGYYGKCSYKGKTYSTGETWYDGCDYECICEDGNTGKYKCNNRCPVYHDLPTDCTLVAQPGDCCLQPVCNFNPIVNKQQSSGHAVTTTGIDVCVYKTKQYLQRQTWRDGCDFQCTCTDAKTGLYTCEDLCPTYNSIPPYCHLEQKAGECCSRPVCEFDSQTGSFQGTGSISGNGVGATPTEHPPCIDAISDCSMYGTDVCLTYRGWAKVNCQKFCNMCPSGMPVAGPNDHCVYGGHTYSQGESWNTSCSTTCTCENAIYGYYRCVDSCPFYNNVPTGCSVVKKAGQCCPLLQCNTGYFLSSSTNLGSIGNGGAITVLKPPTGMTQLVPTLPSGQQPVPGTGGTGFHGPTLDGCLYKGRVFVQNQAWEDGCRLSCYCKDAMTGLYTCKEKCPSYPQLPPSCVLLTDSNDECCKKPTCTADPVTHQIPVPIPVFKPSTQSHGAVMPPTGTELQTGAYSMTVYLVQTGMTPAPPTAPAVPVNTGGIGYCLYNGKQYQHGQLWEDGCDFNCVCDDASKGHYTCTERCLHYPNLPKGCYLVKDPVNPCCDVPRCDLPVNYITHMGELRTTTPKPTGEYCVYEGTQYQQGQTWYDGCSFKCTCEDAVNDVYQCLTRCPEYENINTDFCDFVPDPRDPSCCQMPKCNYPGSTTSPNTITAAPPGTFIGQGTTHGYCKYKGVQYSQGQTWQDGCQLTCECTDAESGLYRCRELCERYTDLPPYCNLITDFTNPCCKKPRCNFPGVTTSVTGTGTTAPTMAPTPHPPLLPGQTVGPTMAPHYKYCLYKGVHYSQGRTWEDGCQYRCRCDDADKGLYVCTERCANYDQVPSFCTMVTDPDDSCCLVPSCPLTPAPTVPGQPTPGPTQYQIPTFPPGEVTGAANVPTQHPGMTPAPINYCEYKGHQYQQGDKWDDGCDFVCQCVDAVKGLYKCTEKCTKYPALPSNCRLSKDPANPCCSVPECIGTMIPTPKPGQTIAPTSKPSQHVCTYKDQMYTQGQQWYDGCDYVCVCEDEAAGLYTCNNRCPSYGALPAECHMVRSTSDPLCCQEPKCIFENTKNQTTGYLTPPIPTPGVIEGGAATPVPMTTLAPQPGQPTPTPAPKVCVYKGNVYQQGQQWQDGCDFNCECVDVTTGHYRCTEMCPKLDDLPSGCRLITDPYKPCCKKAYCPANIVPTPAPSGATSTTAASKTGCTYNGVLFKQGEKWNDGCELVCYCEDEMSGFYRCRDRCNKYESTGNCQMITDPRDTCCRVPDCSALTTPAGYSPLPGYLGTTWVPGMIPTPAPGFTFPPYLIPTPAPGMTYAPGYYPSWFPGMMPTPSLGFTFAPNKIPTPAPGYTYAPGKFPSWVSGMMPTPAPGVTFAPNKVPTPAPGRTYAPDSFPTWVPGMIPTPAPGYTFAPDKIPTPAPGMTYAPGYYPSWVPGMKPTPAPGYTYPPYMIPTPAPGLTYAPGKYPMFTPRPYPTPAQGQTFAPNIPGMIPTPSPGQTYPPYLIPTPAPGQTYAPGQFPSWVPGMYPTFAPGITMPPWLVPTPAPGRTYAPFHFPSWIQGMIPTPAPGYTFSPSKIPTPAPGMTYAPGNYPSWVPGMMPTPIPGVTFAPNKIPTPAPGRTYAPDSFPTWVPGMMPTPAPGLTFSPNNVPTPAPGRTYAPDSFPTWVPGMIPTPAPGYTYPPYMIPTPAPGLTYAPGKYPMFTPRPYPTPAQGQTFAPNIPGMIPTPSPGQTYPPYLIPTPAPGQTYAPGQFPSWVPGMYPTFAPGITMPPWLVPTPAPGRTYAPFHFPSWIQGMIPTPAPGYTFSPSKIPTPAPGMTYAPGNYPSWVPGMMPTPIPGVTFAPNKVPTPAPGRTYAPDSFPTWVPGMMPTPAPGLTFSPNKVPTPASGRTYAPDSFPTWVPGMMPTPIPGVSFAPNKVPTPAPGRTYAPDSFPTWVPGMMPTPAPGLTFSPNNVPTPAPGRTYAPDSFPTWVPGMIPTPAPGYTYPPYMIPTPAPGLTYAPGKYPMFTPRPYPTPAQGQTFAPNIPGMIPTPSPGQTYPPYLIPTPAPGQTYAPGQFPSWVPGMYPTFAPGITMPPWLVPTPAPGRTYAPFHFPSWIQGMIPTPAPGYTFSPSKIPTPAPGMTYAPGNYPSWVPGMMPTPIPGVTFAPNKVPTPAPGRTYAPDSFPTWVPGMIPTPAPGYTFAPDKIPTPAPGMTYAPGYYPSWVPGMKPTPAPGYTYPPYMIPTPAPGLTYAPGNFPSWVQGPTPAPTMNIVPTAIAGIFQGVGVNGNRTGCVHYGVIYKQGEKWQDGCQFDCECLDEHTGRYQCIERCPPYLHLPNNCRLVIDPNDACCKIPYCATDSPSTLAPSTRPTSTLNPYQTFQPTSYPPIPTSAPTPKPTLKAQGCVMDGKVYLAGQNWYMGCDKKCVCEDGMTGFYRCFDRCASYPSVPAGCKLVPDPKDPTCCEVPQCIPLPGAGQTVPTGQPITVTGLPGVISGSGTPAPITPGTNGFTSSPNNVCVYKDHMYKQGDKWQDGCRYNCVCTDGMTGKYECTERCPTFPFVPPECKMTRDPDDICCFQPVCIFGKTTSPPFASTVSPPLGSTILPPLPPSYCVYKGVPYRQGQIWEEGCSKKCRCDDADMNIYTCFDRCKSFNTLDAGCMMVMDPNDACCQLPQCQYFPTPTFPLGVTPTGQTPCPYPMPTAVPGKISGGPQPDPITGDQPTNIGYCEYKGVQYNQGQSWDDGCSYKCSCIDGSSGTYQCEEICPHYVGLPSYCRMIPDPQNSCCQKPSCDICPTGPPSTQVTGGPSRLPTPTPLPKCYMNGKTYSQGQKWYDGCKQVCICDDEKSGAYTCTARCPSYQPVPGCVSVPDPNDPVCCQAPKCGNNTGVFGVFNGSGTPPTPSYITGPTIMPPSPTSPQPKVCVYKGTSYTQGQKWQDGCQYECECVDANTGNFKCIDRCPRFPDLPASCHLVYDPINPCCMKPECQDSTPTQGPTPGPGMTTTLSPYPTPSSTDFCMYHGVPIRQGQSLNDGCDKVCTCEDAVSGKVTCRERCATFPRLNSTCTLVIDPQDTCCQIPQCRNPFTGSISGLPGTITGSSLPKPNPNYPSMTGSRDGCVYNGQIYQQGQTWDDGCKYTCTCYDSTSGRYTCTDKCPRLPPLPSYCSLTQISQCCQEPTCQPLVPSTLVPPTGGYTTPSNVCVYKGSAYQQGQQWYDGCDEVCVCEDSSKNIYRCQARCAKFPNVQPGCTLVPNPQDPSCCQIPDCPLVVPPSPRPGFYTAPPMPAGVISGSGHPSPAPGSTLPPPYREGCVYKGSIFYEGDKFDDGCDYSCECLSNVTGRYRCEEKCYKYTNIPTECQLIQDPNKPCCQVPYCDSVPHPILPTPGAVPTPQPGVITVAPYLVPGLKTNVTTVRPGIATFTDGPSFQSSSTSTPLGFCVYKGVYYTQGQTWDDGCSLKCRCDDVARGYYTCSQRCPSYPSSSCQMRTDPSDSCCLIPDCNHGNIPTPGPAPSLGQSTSTPFVTPRPISGSFTGTSGGNPVVVPFMTGSSTSGNTPACIYKGSIYTQGQKWDDGCTYKCECVDANMGQYKCDDRCARFPYLPASCHFQQSATDFCCQEPICDTYLQPTSAGPTIAPVGPTSPLPDKCVYTDSSQHPQGSSWRDGCNKECKCEEPATNLYTCKELCPVYSGLPAGCILVEDPSNTCCKKPVCQLPNIDLTPIVQTSNSSNNTPPPNVLNIVPIGTHTVFTGYSRPNTGVGDVRHQCVYKGVVYNQGQSWDDDCQYVCTCLDGRIGLYRCTSKCPLYPQLPSYCRDVKVPGQCCPSVSCDIPGYGTYNPVPQLTATPGPSVPPPSGVSTTPMVLIPNPVTASFSSLPGGGYYLPNATYPAMEGHLRDKCVYKNRIYNQGDTWEDGCDYSCECLDGRAGYYGCKPLCPVYNNLPSNQCLMVKDADQCCAQPMCYDPKTDQLVNPLTSSSVFPVVGTYSGGFSGFRPTYQMPGTFTGIRFGCYYKGTTYRQNQQWDDGCDFSCKCLDEARGLYQCHQKCPGFTKIPPLCKLVDKDRCCKEVVCNMVSNVSHPLPPSGQITLPPTTSTGCSDKLDNCRSYGQKACDSTYGDWGRRNCFMFCGYCPYTAPPPKCEDKLPDCRDYGQGACTGIYKPWSQDNCRQYCGFCNITTTTATSVTTDPPAGECKDTLSTCDLLDFDFYCHSPEYQNWAQENCRKTCHMCPGEWTTPTPSPSPTSSYPWMLFMKGVAGAPGPDLYQLWHSGQTLNPNEPLASHLTSEFNGHYKPDYSNHWNKYCIDQVKVSIYNNGIEKMSIVFNATGADKNSWFTSDRIIDSSYTDIRVSQKESFSMSGDANTGREWYISGHSSPQDGCDSYGWLMVSTKSSCPFEMGDSKPSFYYAPGTNQAHWGFTNPGTGDVFAIQAHPTCMPGTETTTQGSNSTQSHSSCTYKGDQYNQGSSWTDGCQYNCTCKDSSIGFYQCRDLCPSYSALPPGCSLITKPGQCCAEPDCSVTTKQTIVFNITGGCFYKGRTYNQGQTWDDGCTQSCTCTDGSTGSYSCRAVCLNWQSLPSSCHLEDAPPGLCCQQPKCPASIIIQIPSAYQSQYPGYTYV